MNLPSTPSPTLAPAVRRRKKRSTPTNSVPGSSLNGLNRNSIRIVVLLRGYLGYGFTISGQKPCLLRCIVEGSPAADVGLRPGNCLVGVNGKDVSHLPHDDVVALIGTCTGLLRLHVADSYFSESSDEETLETTQPRPKYHQRPRSLSKGLPTKKVQPHGKLPSMDSRFVTDPSRFKSTNSTQKFKDAKSQNLAPDPNLHEPTWKSVLASSRRVFRPPVQFGDESPVPPIPARTIKVTNPNVEIVRVFPLLDSANNESSSSTVNVSASELPTKKESSEAMSDRFNTHSSSGSIVRTTELANSLNGNTSPRSNSSLGTECIDLPIYQAVVGYVGSVELPEIVERKRLQALTACVRRLRVERRMRSIVLLRIQSNGISVFSSSQNVQTGPPLAFYSSNIISFSGAYSDDRRFFGLVTCTSPTKQCSCHVFMVEPKLLSHTEHLKRARAFGIQCTFLPVLKSEQVLGLQECSEFPATADPILNSILRLHRGPDQPIPRSPSEASTRLESTNSSNSDSGIGFRDDCDRNSARIYDIVEPELLFDIKNIRRSPVPRRRYPHQNKKSLSLGFPSHNFGKLSVKDVRNDILCESQNLQHEGDFGNTKDQANFQIDHRSLQEILQSKKADSLSATTSSNRDILKPMSAENSSENNVPPNPIEVSVVDTPLGSRERNRSMERNEPLFLVGLEKLPSFGTPLSRKGTRSLDNLCSPEILDQKTSVLNPKMNNVGNSTPALNQETDKCNANAGDEIWEFKIPQPPKAKMEVNVAELWAESIEKLLGDPCGREVFTEFLQREFSAENIMFYNTCLQFKSAFPNLTESQKISMASTIFQRFLQNGATDPVNVDFQARSQVEKSLSQTTIEMFDLPLFQVFNLLKFDCYPRFLRSDLYRDYCSGAIPLPPFNPDPSDSDQDSVKSHKLPDDGRRRSLLPWNIKNRSKKSRSKSEADGLNSDISFIQKTAMNQNFDSSDPEDGMRRQSYKLCRVILPDTSTTVLPCKPGESLSYVVQKLLEKREFSYSAFEVISVANGKALDLNQEASEMTAREIRVEPRAFIGIELPRGWKVGVRANPNRKVSEVLKPIIAQHSLKLDAVIVHDIETDEIIDLNWRMGKIDGRNLNVQLRGSKTEDVHKQIQDSGRYNSDAYVDDDDLSSKGSSSQSTSVLRGFLRRSSRKYKRKTKNGSQPAIADNLKVEKNSNESHPIQLRIPADEEHLSTGLAEENLNLRFPSLQQSQFNRNQLPESPLSSVSSELNLADHSRNRKPIYIAQSNQMSQS